jgi:5-(carboxyamino)imidazole ribonucleotide synthase
MIDHKPGSYTMPKVGILGGGQLGQMLIQAGIPYGISFHVLDPDPQASCQPICANFTTGSFKNADAVFAFGKNLDVVTIEIEHVSVEGLLKLKDAGVKVFPQPEVVALIQDKTLQKQFYQEHGLPCSAFTLVASPEEVLEAANQFPVVFKSAKGGYDGKGVKVLNSPDDIPEASLFPGMLEELVDIDKELAVIVARTEDGSTSTFPMVEMIFNPDANLVEELISPAMVHNDIQQQGAQLANQLADALGIVGLLAVEFFLDKSGNLLINEVAPRPHNSGHHTIKANAVSQFEQHLRAILGLPLGSTKAFCHAAMLNILGEPQAHGMACYEGTHQLLNIEQAFFHLYGKQHVKPFRKMGHITLLAQTSEQLQEKIAKAKNLIKALA